MERKKADKSNDMQLHSMQLKKKWNLIQNSPAVKNKCVALKKAILKKDVKSKVAACDGSNDNSGEFGV